MKNPLAAVPHGDEAERRLLPDGGSDGEESVSVRQRRHLCTKSKLFLVLTLSSLGFLAAMRVLPFGGFSSATDRRMLENVNFVAEHQRFLDEVNATGCSLPIDYDIRDPQIKRYIEKAAAPIICGRPQPYLTWMDWSGKLYLNKTEQRPKDLSCVYQTVTGDPNDDYKVLYAKPTKIESFPISIPYPVIRVNCTSRGKRIYTMIHSQILPLNQSRIDMNKAIPRHRPSVLIFTIDSMSRGNFIRTLPKTYDYLVEKHGMTVFKGLNKVADNTYPNMMALLGGFMKRPRPEMPHVPVWTVKENSTMGRYDDMPIIWKDFQKAGYVTMYAEEYLDATFSLLDVGFKEDPVDYYYRSSYVGLKQNLGPLNKGRKSIDYKYCVGNEPSYKYVMNYTEEFLSEMAALRYFAFGFLVEVSHDYLNDVKNLDVVFVDFFRRMFDGGAFENTVILVMGDHGHRFDDIRSTYIGRLEERMPFLGIAMPETLRKSHPHLQLALESHTERLLSWYDIHETLVDLALDDIMEIPLYPRPKAVGKSILKFFDDNRTCADIGILPEYCMCDREAQIPTSAPKSYQSAEIVIKTINDHLKTSSLYIKRGESRSCSYLTLNKILSVTMSMKSFSASSPKSLVRVIVEAKPSMGLFEAAVEFVPGSQPRVMGDINRINKYGNQPSCISHDVLRLYCYCV